MNLLLTTWISVEDKNFKNHKYTYIAYEKIKRIEHVNRLKLQFINIILSYN